MSGIPTYGVKIDLLFSHNFLTAKPIEVDATVGIVGTAKTKHLKYFPTLDLALASTSDFDDESEIKQAMLDLKACGVDCKVITSGYLKNNDANTQKTNAMSAIEELKKAPAVLDQLPSFILTTSLKGVETFTKAKAVADELRAIFFIECEKKTVAEVKTEVPNLKSPRCVTSFQTVIRADGQNKERPLSAFILGNWFKLIFANSRGLRQTFSNKPIAGISSIKDVVEHAYDKDKDSNTLRDMGVTVAIKAPDMLFWGDGVRDPDPLGFKVIKDVLLIDLTTKRLYEVLRVLVDTEIRDVTQASLQYCRNLLEDLRIRGIIYQYTVEPDAEKNTPAKLASGHIYLKVKLQSTINCKFIGVTITLTDEFTESVLGS